MSEKPVSALCFIDTETTGLDPQAHQAVEVAFALDDGPIRTFLLSHTLENADSRALAINGYFGRNLDDPALPGTVQTLARTLRDVTLVGSNPAFDAAFLRRTIGFAPWKHRLIDVSNCAMWEFGWDRPAGLNDVAAALRADGYEIPEPDHTATGDVAVTRDVYYALRARRRDAS